MIVVDRKLLDILYTVKSKRKLNKQKLEHTATVDLSSLSLRNFVI